MVRFCYDMNQHNVEVRASNWCGLEQLLLDGEVVSRKFTLAPRSEHRFMLKNGEQCHCQLITDANDGQTLCRLYRQEKLIASLKYKQQTFTHGYHWLILASIACLLMVYL